ncbi:MAG: DUF5615 family PIN-like protein [Caldilineales bacterium]|nr:DUF5615 family PIN-like protein [Caldilineales bacterium]
MKFLLDQDVYAVTRRFLNDLGHDVVTAASVGLSRASDESILEYAETQDRILVTRDSDFGGLVFVRKIGAGVIFLRMLPSSADVTHTILKRVIEKHTEAELSDSFVVVEPAGYRIRHLSRND